MIELLQQEDREFAFRSYSFDARLAWSYLDPEASCWFNARSFSPESFFNALCRYCTIIKLQTGLNELNLLDTWWTRFCKLTSTTCFHTFFAQSCCTGSKKTDSWGRFLQVFKEFLEKVFERAQQLVEFQSLVPPDSRSFCMVEVVEDASMIVINRIRDGKDHTPHKQTSASHILQVIIIVSTSKGSSTDARCSCHALNSS
jgi:hypothetical protein